MLKKESIKGLIFDYGGTLDTNGIHWSEVLWEMYLHRGSNEAVAAVCLAGNA